MDGWMDQAYMASQYLRDLIPREGIKFLVRVLVVGVVGAFLLLFSYLTITVGRTREAAGHWRIYVE